MKMRKIKKGLSQVVTTVLLITLVIVLSLIILAWARSLIKEIPQKQGKSAEQACQEISLQTQFIENKLYITNIGNIPVYKFDIKKTAEGRTTVQNVDESLFLGASKEITLDKDYEKIEIIPTVLGTIRGIEQEYICEKYGIEVK